MVDNRPNEEGYVLHYHKADLRIKIKMQKYVELHRLLFNMSERLIIETMQRGGLPSDTLKKFGVKGGILPHVELIEGRVRARMESLCRLCADATEATVPLPTRKDKALALQVYPKIVQTCIFSWLDGHADYEPALWEYLIKNSSGVKLQPINADDAVVGA